MICINCFNETKEGNYCDQCGFHHTGKRPEKALPQLKTLAGRYVIGRVLGAGGFGITYLAYDMQTRTRVCVKECVPDAYSDRVGDELKAKPGMDMQFEGTKDTFTAEMSALDLMKNTPGVVRMYDSFSENNTYYYTMDFIEGVSLKYLVTKNGGRIDWNMALYVLLTVGSGIMMAHANGIVHRDISPENIMVDENGNVWLIDFGTAASYIYPRSEKAIFLKHGFAPPEQYVLNGEIGPYTDVYALAATFYTSVSGQPLIDSRTRLDEQDIMKPMCRIDGCDVPFRVSDIIENAMSLDVEERYFDINKFFDDLEEFASYAKPFDSKIMGYIETFKPHDIRTGDSKSHLTGYSYPYVEMLTGPNKGKTYKIHDYGFTLVGRDPDHSEIVLTDSDYLSRKHCLVGYDRVKNRFIVIDVSYWGTYYSNGRRMLHNAESYLQENETFMLYSSDVQMRVILK